MAKRKTKKRTQTRKYTPRKSTRKTRKRVVRRSAGKAFKYGEEFGGRQLIKMRNSEGRLQDQLNTVQDSISEVEGTTAHGLTRIINSHGIENVKNVIICPDDKSCVATVVFKGKQVEQEDLNVITGKGYSIKSIASKGGCVHVTFED